jgi:acyl carrier protein
MVDRGAVIGCVFDAIDETNQQLSPGDAIVKSTTALLYGGSGPLDSLSLVMLIFALEEQLESHLGCTVSLMAESGATDSDDDPFQSVETLVDWLTAILARRQAA